MRQALCPFHVGHVQPELRADGYYCPAAPNGCGRKLPGEYVENPCRPAMVAAVGYPGHGKTVYFSVLMGVFTDTSKQNLGTGFFSKTLNPESAQRMLDSARMLRDGRLPPPTTYTFEHPTVVRVSNMSMVGTRDLLFYDVSGEAFERWGRSGQPDERIVRYFTLADTLLVMLSPTARPTTRNPWELMDSYVGDVSSRPGGANSLKSKRVVLMYTRGDEMITALHKVGFGDVANYLTAEPGPIDDDYSSILQYISGRLAEFTCAHIPGGLNFHNLCADHFAAVHYSIVSALGSAPTEVSGGNTSGVRQVQFTEPRRIADPLILGLPR